MAKLNLYEQTKIYNEEQSKNVQKYEQVLSKQLGEIEAQKAELKNRRSELLEEEQKFEIERRSLVNQNNFYYRGETILPNMIAFALGGVFIQFLWNIVYNTPGSLI